MGADARRRLTRTLSPMPSPRLLRPVADRGARHAHLAVVLGCAAVAACADAGAGERDPRGGAPVAPVEWEWDVTHLTGHPIAPNALRAGSGLAVMLQVDPPSHWLFILHRESGPSGHGNMPYQPAGTRLAHLGQPTDVVGVHADSATAPADAWFLDAARGRVIGDNVGGMTRTIAGFGTRGTVRTACALGARAIAYLDEARPDTVLVRALHAPYAVRAYAFPDGLLTGRDVRWTDLRFGGSQDGPCVLHARRMRGVVVVTDTAVHAVAPFVEPLSRVDSLYAAGAWYARLVDLVTSDGDREGAIDATSWHGGAAVLFAGRTPDAGRVVDFYDARGAYVTSMRLPHRALRIAATRHRLVVLRQRHGEVFLSSFVLPAEVRGGAASDEAEVIAPDGSAVVGRGAAGGGR